MGFIMPWWRKCSIKQYSIACFWLCCVLGAPLSHAIDGIQIKSAELRQVSDQYVLYAQMNVTLTPLLQDALNRGVSLYFITDFTFMQPRWYWFAEELAHMTRVTRLSYNPLIRQYFVSGVNAGARSTDHLDAALAMLGDINGWTVIARDKLSKITRYQATLSMRLDTSLLPKPLQINAIATGRWDLEATPLVWTMNP